MQTNILLNKLEGIQTIITVKDTLRVSKAKAIYYLHRLRKKGYVKTKRLSNNQRVYDISFENKLGGLSYIDIINKYSPIKLAVSETHKIYGTVPSFEETLIYAIKTNSIRTILAALGLFRKIQNWSLLYQLAKQNHLEKQVGVLYDVSRLTIKKVRRMSKTFRNHALPKKYDKYHYLVKGLSSNDFKQIEKTWKIYIPFNKTDLEVYAWLP